MKLTPVLMIAGVVVALSGCAHSPRNIGHLPQAHLVQEASKPGERAVSLKMLQQELRDGATGAEHEDLLSLCGLRRIDAALCDARNHDIVILGSTEGRLPLHTQDLALALQCTFRMYLERRGSKLYYTDPGVTIDPNPRVNRLLAETVPGQPGRLEAFQRLGRQPNAVRVLGMPLCRAAAVAVNCDYYCKRLTNGSAAIPVKGFESLFDIRAKAQRDHPFSTSTAGANSMDRFEFVAGDTRVLETRDGEAELGPVPVQLITEAEYLARGSIHGSGHPDPVAKAWADRFSSHFADIAAHDTRYQDLLNLYRMFAIGGLLHDQSTEFDTEDVLSYLLNDFSVPAARVPRQLPGLTRVEEEKRERPTPYGKEVAYWSHTSCGGVGFSVPLRLQYDLSGQVRALSDRVRATRPSPLALSWPVLL